MTYAVAVSEQAARELHFVLGSRPTHRAVFTIVHETVVVVTVRHAAQDRLQQSDMKTP